MWQERQSELLKKEIEALLSPLSETSGLYELVIETLTTAKRGLALKADQRRPWSLLSLIVCESIRGDSERAVPAAAALQLLMAAGDVFDDIEDADAPGSLPARYGPAVAINVGTILVSLAEKAITRLKKNGVKNNVIVRIMDVVNSSFIDACAGQHLDLTFSLESRVTEETYIKTVGLKSASQVECACHIGSLLGGANQKIIDIFTKFGYNLGMAGQISNDIQGIIGESDILKPKITLPFVYALSQTEGESRRLLESIFHKRSDEKSDNAQIRDLLFRSGAVHYATVKMEIYRQQAMDIISEAEGAGVRVEKLRLFLQ